MFFQYNNILIFAVFVFVNGEYGNKANRVCKENGLKMVDCRRILYGSKERVPADVLEFPHMVLIGYKPDKNKEIMWNCGGSLISTLWILTAAHCINDPRAGKPKQVILGTTTFEEEEYEDIIQTRNITEIMKHPGYKPPLKYNDIALLKMNMPVEVGKEIRIACLATKNILLKKAIASGFGKTDFDHTTGSKTMMHVKVDIIPKDPCKKSLRSLIKKNGVLKYGILKSQICAGDLLNGGRDTCQGDSGGPLQTFPKDINCKNTFPLYTIIGVTSFGRFCGFKNSPGVYTNVTEFIPWIENIVWPDELD